MSVSCALPCCAFCASTPGGASLDLRRAGTDRILLAWPASPPAVLEERASLVPGDAWRPYAGAVTGAGGSNLVEVIPTGRERYFRLVELPVRELTRPAEISPAPGETGVAVTRETILRFTRPLGASTTLGTDRLHASAGGRRILSRAELAADGRTARLFFLENLPGSALVTVQFDGDGLLDADGEPLDADGDGQPGGVASWSFATANLAPLPGTAVVGRVFASERRNGTNVPLAGVTITVDGAEETLRAVTGPDGVFWLNPSPAGRFFVHVDGRTAEGSLWPGGAYHPFVGKAWEAVAGRTNNLAGGTGEIFLPLVAAAALQPVSATETTVITFPPEVLAANPALAGVRIEVPPNALFADNGTRGGRLGLAPVPPDRLPEPLPPGLNPPLVITIQSDGPMNFDQPVPVRFPNLPDPVTGRRLPPGAKTALWSFNHDTGLWEIAGPATVSADGAFVVTDPGVGVRQPGWHAAAPGTQPGEPGGGPWGGRRGASGGGGGGGGGGGEGEPECPEAADLAFDAALDFADCAASLAGVDQWISAGTELIRNFDTLLETTDRMVEASSVDATTCDRIAALAAQLNSAGQLIADLAQPFIAEADPTRLADAVVGCGVSLARDAAAMVCASLCRRGTATNQRCDDLDSIVDAGVEVGELLDTNLRDPDSATELAFGVAETAANALVASLDAYCDSGRRGVGLAAPDPRLLELRARAREYRDAVADAQAKAVALVAAGQEVRRRLAEWLGLGVGTISAWMIEDRAWADGYYRLSAEGEEFRARVGRAGEFRLPVVAPNTRFLLEVYEPRRGVYGRVEFTSADNGFPTAVPAPRLVSLRDRRLHPDADGDGLPDVVETVIGTRPDHADTDGDGRGDGVELADGENPLAAGAPAMDGVTANVPVSGSAVDLAETGADTLAVATGTGGVALFSTAVPDLPLHMGSILVGRRELRLAGGPGRLLVSEEASGLRLYDVSDPARPQLRWSQSDFNRISALAILGDRALYVSGRNLVARDLESGAELWRRDVGAGEALLPLGPRVALLAGTELRLLELEPGGVVQRAAVTVPDSGVPGAEWGRRLAAADGLLAGGGQAGFFTVGRTATDEWSLRGAPPAGQPPVFAAAFLDERLLAAVVRDPGWPDSRVRIHDLRDPGDVTRRLSTYDTPGDARAVLWHAGRLFVADGPAGLTLIRHDAALPDASAPTLELTGDFSGVSSQEALAPYTLRARLSGGHRGRVEYFLNGTRLGRTAFFPHVWTGVAPPRTAATPNLVFTARALTSGGGVVESAPLVVPLTDDVTPPRVAGLSPERSALAGIGTVREVRATFSEELDAATVTDASLTVVGTGPDGVFGTADDAPAGGSLVRASRVRSLSRVFSTPLVSGRYQARLGETLADAAGNRLVPPLVWEFTVETPRQWVSDEDGLWGVLDNWLDRVLPRSGDSALIDRPAANPVVTLRNNPSFPLTIRRLISREAFRLDGALQVDDLAIFDGPLWITNASRLGTTNRIEARGPVTWSGSGSPFLVARQFSSAGPARLELGVGQMLYLQPPVGETGAFINEETGVFEMVSAGQQTHNGFGSVPQFVNRGTFRAAAPGGGTNRISNLFLDNQGLIEVASGTLELAFGLTNRGRVVVPSGTSLQVTGHRFEASEDASLTGDGSVRIALPQFGTLFPTIRGVVDLGGTLELLNGISPLAFAGERVRLNHVVVDQAASAAVLFRPLSLAIRSLHLRQGQVWLRSSAPVELLELETGTEGTGGGQLGVETPVTVNGPARLASLWVGGSAPLRLAGPSILTGELILAGLAGTDETPVLELARPLPLAAGSRLEITFNGMLRVLPGIEFVIPEGIAVQLGGTLVNEGVVSTPDGLTGTADAARGGTLLNRGRLEARSGLLRLPRVLQTSGSTRLAGGRLTCLQGLELEGGELTGAGDLHADLTNSGGVVSPGGEDIGTLALGQDSGWGGRFRQNSGGRLVLDLAGRDHHDRVTAVLGAVLGGVLEVRLAEGFFPAEGDAFALVTGPGFVSGTFDEVRLPTLPGERRLEVVYESQTVRLVVR